MPSIIIKSLSKKLDVPVKDLEKVWKEAKEISSKLGRSFDIDYVIGIFQKLCRVKYK